MSGNIIQFHAESWDGRMLGCQGFHPALATATPHVDALARQGAHFANAYCTNPICCPSRANMLAGAYTHSCESWGNSKGLEQGMWTYHQGLRETHDVLLLGKHMDYLTGGHSVMNRVADLLEPLNTRGLPVMNADNAQNFGVREDSQRECHASDWQMADEAIQFLRSRQKGDRPFFISLNPRLVHAAFRTNRYWVERIPEELVDTPPLDDTGHPANEYQKRSKAWRHGFDEKTVKLVRRVYFAMCAEADAIFGEVMAALEESGLAGDTTVIFSGDHGEFALEHQQYYKMSLFEAAARVPLVMRGPGIKAGRRIETPVSLVDMAPTLCELAGLPSRESFDGESLLPLARGETVTSRGWALASYSGTTSNTMSWMLRKGDYKLIVHEGYPSRLFDVRKDPAELNDLIEAEPEKAAELLAILDSQVDRRETVRIWSEWRKHSFAQFQRQAKRGLYSDGSYSLIGRPSSNYHDIMDNAFTGWNEQDETRVRQWLNDEIPSQI